MTWEEYMTLTDWMTVRWGEVARWGEEKLYAMFEDLRAWPVDGALRVVKSHYEDGNVRAPHGGQIISLLRSTGYKAELDANEDHHHTWGFVESGSGRRDAICVVCSVERSFTDKQLRTPLEWEEHRKKEATG